MRPEWDDYFLGIAQVVAQRSHDAQTQHGCVITDANHRIIGVGYNGFPRGMDDSSLPTTRPEKYPWMIHAERNALSNCVIRPDKGIAYVTGQCCNDCIMALWQEGVETVVMAKNRFDFFVKNSGMKIFYKDADLSWMSRCI